MEVAAAPTFAVITSASSRPGGPREAARNAAAFLAVGKVPRRALKLAPKEPRAEVARVLAPRPLAGGPVTGPLKPLHRAIARLSDRAPSPAPAAIRRLSSVAAALISRLGPTNMGPGRKNAAKTPHALASRRRHRDILQRFRCAVRDARAPRRAHSAREAAAGRKVFERPPREKSARENSAGFYTNISENQPSQS